MEEFIGEYYIESDKIVVKEETIEEENKYFDDDFEDEEPPDNQSVDITVEKCTIIILTRKSEERIIIFSRVSQKTREN